MKKISIIIPVYYNEQSLPILFHRLLEIEKMLLAKNIETELIFVDDGSGDNSMQKLIDIKAQRVSTKVIKLTRNFGAIHASKIGLYFVTGDCFIILAADLQDPPELIIEMTDRWDLGAKYVVCAREQRRDPLLTKIYAYLYYKLLALLVIKNYPQGGYDMALMDKAMLPHLQNSSKNINTPLFAYWLGFKPDIIYYTRRKREFGKSRWTFSKKLKFFLDSILGFSIIPIRFISFVGLIVSMVSFIYGVSVTISALRGFTDVRGFATLTALMSFLLGLIIIMLGVIGEYVWRIFDEVNKRPEVVIDEIY